MTLPLENIMKFGVQTIYRRTEPAVGPWTPDTEDARRLIRLVDNLGYDSMWVGDHVAFTIPILESITQLSWACGQSERLTFGTGIYLLPLRHPTPVAKAISTLDHLCGGKLIFGVGVGGEFPNEFEACGIPVNERGARLNEGIAVLRKLWHGGKVSNDGKFYPFPDIELLPTPFQKGGPPIWCGGRSEGALARAGKLCDGYISYVVTPEMFSDSMEKISAAAEAAGRDVEAYGTGHLLFLRIDDSYEKALDAATEALSVRYAMDFRRPAQKYCALGPPADIAAKIEAFKAAGVRHFVLDFVGPYEQRDQQITRFAKEVRPLLGVA